MADYHISSNRRFALGFPGFWEVFDQIPPSGTKPYME